MERFEGPKAIPEGVAKATTWEELADAVRQFRSIVSDDGGATLEGPALADLLIDESPTSRVYYDAGSGVFVNRITGKQDDFLYKRLPAYLMKKMEEIAQRQAAQS